MPNFDEIYNLGWKHAIQNVESMLSVGKDMLTSEQKEIIKSLYK